MNEKNQDFQKLAKQIKTFKANFYFHSYSTHMVEATAELTYVTMENVDYWGADLWNPCKTCESWEEFVKTAKLTMKPGQVMMWNTTNNKMYLKSFTGALPKAAAARHIIICGKAL